MFRSLFVYTRKKMTGEYWGVIINLSGLAAWKLKANWK